MCQLCVLFVNRQCRLGSNGSTGRSCGSPHTNRVHVNSTRQFTIQFRLFPAKTFRRHRLFPSSYPCSHLPSPPPPLCCPCYCHCNCHVTVTKPSIHASISLRSQCRVPCCWLSTLRPATCRTSGLQPTAARTHSNTVRPHSTHTWPIPGTL